MTKVSPTPEADAAVQRGRTFWSRRYQRLLSLDESDEIRMRMLTFINLLRAWDEQARSHATANSSDAGPSNAA